MFPSNAIVLIIQAENLISDFIPWYYRPLVLGNFLLKLANTKRFPFMLNLEKQRGWSLQEHGHLGR